MTTPAVPPVSKPKFNLLASLFMYLPLIGPIVQGIQQVHGDAVAGATKKQLAMESLGIASATAGALLPGEAIEVDAATTLASTLIDAFVAAYKKVGWGNVPTVPILPVAALPPAATAAVKQLVAMKETGAIAANPPAAPASQGAWKPKA